MSFAMRCAAVLGSALLLVLSSLSSPAWAQSSYGQATVTSVSVGLSASLPASSNTPSFRSNPECAMDLVATSPTLFALGGYNITGGGATLPSPVYGQADLWLSTNGFASATWRAPVTVNNLTTQEVGRISGAAGYLANGNLVWTGGIISVAAGTITYSASTYCSVDKGLTWARSLTSNATYTPPTTRYEMSYTVLPYTNTMVIGGGYMPFVTGEGGADVWMSSDGTGSVWTQRNAGGSVPNNYGGAMAAYYDSSAVSSTFTQAFSTILWVMTVGSYYLSSDGGVTWGTARQAPWAASFLPYPTFTRELPVLTIDHDNYAYYGGGDVGGPASDFWLSIDKAQTWTQLVIQSSSFFGGSQLYAAAVGSCLAVRVLSGGAKELDLYGGNIYIYGRNASNALVYNSSQVYSMQMGLSFASTPYSPQASAVTIPNNGGMRWYFNYQIVSTNPAYTICASGYVFTPQNPTIPTYTSTLAATGASAQYLVWWIQGSRVFSNASTTISQTIAGLGPVGDDGASQYIYPNAAVQVDGGGLTYLLAGTGLGDSTTFINVYSTGTTSAEDYSAGGTLNFTSPIRFSRAPLAPLQGCQVFVQASLSSGLQGAAPSPTSHTSTPQFRSNPECAYDLTTTATLNPTYIALGGFNSTGFGADIPSPIYAQSDLWISTDGFTSAANTRYQASVYNLSTPLTKLSGVAGLLSNGILIYSGGLAGEYGGYIYFSSTTWASADKGATWNISLNTAINPTLPLVSTMRYDSAYCVVPYTNTLIMAGGISYNSYPNQAADVWMSTDGLGRNWTLQNSGTGPRSTITHSAGVMVALYDSTLVSAQYVTPNSTLVLIMDSAAYAKSSDLGRTWSTMYTAPWAPSGVPYATYTRALPVLTVDRDNYLYYGGGDSGSPQADFWFSWDKAESWTRIALVNGLSGYQFAAAIGSCLGVRQTGYSAVQKELDLYGGNIYFRQINATTNGAYYAATPYYSAQMQLSFSTTAYSQPLTSIPTVTPLTWYWAYQVTSTTGFTVCASGTVITPSTPTVETYSGNAAGYAYLVWYLSGSRVYTNSTYAYSEVIGGLAPLTTDGATNLIYPNAAVPVDGGGLTYQLASVQPGSATAYVNLYNNGSYAVEDGFQSTFGIQRMSVPLVFSQSPLTGASAVCSSIIRSQATITQGLAGAPISFTGQTNTPMYRSDPECAYDLNSTNPTMWAMGGYNQTAGTWSLAYPSFGKGDTWYSTDGFSTVANTVYVPGAATYPRIAGMAAYLASGVLLTWGGVQGEYSGYIYFDISVGVSYDKGNTYNYSIYNDPAATTNPSISRYEAAYCALPYTNTVVHVGGVSYITYPNPSSDVWMSSDGLGAVWTQQNAGGSATTVRPFQGGVMAAFYDSSYVSTQYISPNSTLLLVAPTANYYLSFDLGRTWSFQYSPPWFRGQSNYVTITRYLPVLTIDRDNYAYYGGGDMQTIAPDFWLSVDKAQSWSRIQMVNTLGNTLYVAAVGSCMAVRIVGGQKQLSLYGGNIYTRVTNVTTGVSSYTNTALYSLQMTLQFNGSAFPNVNYGVQTATPVTYYWSYQLRQSNASMNQFSVCAYGQLVASATPTIASSAAYPVWSMTGARIYTNSTYSFSQPIAGLSYLNTDGGSNLLYPRNSILVDGGGLTYALGSTGLGEGNAYVNLYSNGAYAQEDGWLTYEVQTIVSNFSVSRTPFNQYNPPCRINAAATVVSSLLGAASTYSGQTSTPQFRSNPECAYDLNSTNPTMFAIGGYNQTGGSAAIPYPVYARPDIWVSTDGFTSSANTQWVAGQTNYSRLASCAAILSNGALLTWCGLIGEYSGYVWFETSVTISLDQGRTWNTTYTDPAPTTKPSVTRMEAAYCALPYTNTVVHVGGVNYITYPNPSSDVWISSDGRGAVWNRQSTGTLPAFRGGAMVALYDSSVVSSAYLTPNATLVLALQQPLYAVSTDLGATWTQYQAPWAATITSSPTFYRSLPALTADHDNYLYYAGGDTQMWAPDMWLSVDKGYTWSRIAITTQLSAQQYGGAIGSCMAVRVVGGQKQLALYGGNILTYTQSTGLFSSTPIYSLQLNLNFLNRTSYNLTTTSYPVPVAAASNIQTLYWQYAYTEPAAVSWGGFSVCASGTAQVSTQTTYSSTGTANPAYLIVWMQGARLTTNASTGVVTSQIITGLGPIGVDGATNLYYPAQSPPIDGGGVTYYLATTGLGETQNYVNLWYNTAGVFAEDSTVGGYSTINVSSPLVFSTTRGSLTCSMYGTATIASGLAGTAPTFSGQTSTPQYRSNPECAYDLTTFNSSSPKMFSIGGYNQTGGSAAIPSPAYARPDIWVSTDGFTSTANTQWVAGQTNYARLAACAAYTASGTLIAWCGLIGEYNGYIVFETSVTVSLDNGASWNTTYTDPAPTTKASVTRMEAAYCALPYTNTIVHAGGINYATYPNPSSDVWMSTDGQGAVWQQMNAGGAANNVPPFSGGQMVAMYDSSVISAQFPSPNATLVLVLDTAQYFKSTSLGWSWSAAYAAPWSASFTPYPTYTRSLPVLAADQDNYLYFAGGDAGGPAPDIWVSVDKAETWTRMATTNSFSASQVYAASVGSCMAVRVVNGQKQLSLFGGNIWTYSASNSAYTSASFYSLQINVAFSPKAPTVAASPVPATTGQLWYWQYKLNSTAGFSICATGRMVTSSSPTLSSIASTNPAYLVWWMSGNRVYTSSTTTMSQVIAGLAPLDVDGASQYFYPSAAVPVDQGGVTYLLSGQGLGESNSFVNLYNSGGLNEDGLSGTVSVVLPFTFSKTPLTLGGCPFYSAATISGGLTLSSALTYAGSSTPVTARYNPECAYDWSSSNPTMFALGGSADGGVTTQPDMWYSTDGFSSAANTLYVNSSAAGRMNGGAAYLANGNLVWWGGLVNDITAATYLTNVYVSNTRGRTWNTSSLGATTLRQSFAYAALPYTNTIVMAGGILYSTGSFSNDVWISSDGAGAVWTQQTNGSGTTVAPHVGAVLVAMFDSNLVSSSYPAQYSTLVLVDHNLVYQSYNLGVTWTNASLGPWPLSYGGTRRFPVLAADRDNFLYFAGGDNVSPDLWFSADKGYSWTQLGTASYTLATGNFAAALGACSAVRLVGSTKYLSIYGGDIYAYASGSYTQNYYSVQLPLAYQGTAPTYGTAPVASASSQTAWWKYTLAGTGYTVCASGTFTLGSAPLLGVLPVAYTIYAINGSRTFTGSSGSVTQTITGLAPIGSDGASNHLYLTQPRCDGGGITYYVNSALAILGGTASVSYVNLYNNSGTVTEDNWASPPTQSGSGFTWALSNDGSYTCAGSPTAVSSAVVRAASSSTAAATAVGPTPTSGAVTPTSARAAATSAPVVPPTGGGGSSGLSGGAIAGIVVGSVVAAALCLLCLLFCACSQRKGKGETGTGVRDSELSTARPSHVEMVAAGEGSELSRVDAAHAGEGHGEEAETV